MRRKKKPQAKLGDRVQLGDRLGIVIQRRFGHAAVVWDDGTSSVCEIPRLDVVMSARAFLAQTKRKMGK